MKITFLGLLLSSFFNHAFAEDLDDDLFSFTGGEEIVAVNQPLSIKDHSGNKKKNLFFVDVEAMILNAGLNHQEFADRVFTTNQIQTHKLSSLPKDYHVGIRGSLGAYFKSVEWGVFASGFHYQNGQTKNAKRQSYDGFIFYPTYSSNLNSDAGTSDTYGKIKGFYAINLNLGDLLFYKKMIEHKHFDFTIDAGFRYLHNHQKMNVDNLNPSGTVSLGANKIRYSDVFCAYGFLFRAHSIFKFTRHFSVDLSIAGSGVYGDNKTTNLAKANPPGSVTTLGSSFTQYDSKVMPIVEFEAKFGYANTTKDESLKYEITAGYFLMDLINSFTGVKIAYEAAGDVQTTTRFVADTVLQGATVGFKITF